MARTHWPARLLPPAETIERWREIAERREEPVDEYARRWVTLWRRVIVACRDQGTWDDRDAEIVGQLVEIHRLAYEHQLDADREGFTTHPDSGRIFAHPGLRLAAERRGELRELAAELLLTPESRRASGLFEDPDPADDDAPRGDQAAAGL